VGRFDQRELTRFVADLYEARDWQADVVESGTLFVQAPRGTPARRSRSVSRRRSRRPGSTPTGSSSGRRRTSNGRRMVHVSSTHESYTGWRCTPSTATSYRGSWPTTSSPEPSPVVAPDSIDSGPRFRPCHRSLLSAANVILVVVLILFASVAFVAADGFERPLTPDEETESTVTPVTVSQAQLPVSTATETPTRSSTLCPRALTDAHPAALRPVPVDAALGVGLEGWEDVRRLNASAFQGPNELTVPWTPEIRHESTYRSPAGTTITLIIDRWADRAAAAKSGRVLANSYRTALVWGGTRSPSSSTIPLATPRPIRRTPTSIRTRSFRRSWTRGTASWGRVASTLVEPTA